MGWDEMGGCEKGKVVRRKEGAGILRGRLFVRRLSSTLLSSSYLASCVQRHCFAASTTQPSLTCLDCLVSTSKSRQRSHISEQ